VKLAGGPALRLCKSFRVLAYVFWHTPAAIDGIGTYEAASAALFGACNLRGDRYRPGWFAE
jgi:hypothetical protein